MDPSNNGHLLLQPSQEVQDKLGKQSVESTEKQARVAVNAWASIQLKSLSNEAFSTKTDEWLVQSFTQKVMPDSIRGQPLSLISLANLNTSLGEFVMHYRTRKGTRLTPASLSNYLEGISRWLTQNWQIDIDVMRNSTFIHPKTGYIHVANKITAEQQANGIRVKSYNVLSDKDVEIIFEDECTQASTPTGYNNRLILVMGMLLGLRATALRKLKWSMFHHENGFDGRPIYRFQGIIGSTDGQSKHARGGLKAAKTIPKSINIFNNEIKFGINPYNMIEQHKIMCSYTKNQEDFFLRANAGACKREKFLSSAVIGESNFPRLIQRIFKATNVRGIGPYEWPVLHSLRKTMITNLLRAKCSDAEVTIRTGHANIQSLRPYANILAEAGVEQQANLLGGSSSQKLASDGSNSKESESMKRSNENDIESATKKQKVQEITSAVINSASQSSNGNITINLTFNL